MIRFERRARPSPVMYWLAPILAVVATVIAGAVLFALLGLPVLDVMHAYFVSPLIGRYGLAELAIKAAPLAMIGVALALGFRAGVWNIGAEGQFVVGATAGGAVALGLYEIDAWYVLPLMTLAGIAGGMFWAAGPAWLKVRFGTNEILTTLMLSYVAGLLLSYLVHGPLRNPDGFNFPESRLFHDAASLPRLLDGTRLHIGAPLAVVLVVVASLLLSRTLLGLALRAGGDAPRAARHAGFDPAALVWFSLLAGGGVAGLAGLLEIAGPIGQLQPEISPGYGFTAIIVAFLGRLHPVGVLCASLVMALSYLGGESAQIGFNLPVAVTGVFQGLLLFFLLAADVFIVYRVVWWSSTGRHPADPTAGQRTTNDDRHATADAAP